ncbi:MAG: hypothetical protein DRP96_06940 [Candidatus Neomarinimicrobiota bacterium]|nr:MAG: hypothetical protein DRP96_06940 [Candidatus Neomarinimicrobiota bacterium]
MPPKKSRKKKTKSLSIPWDVALLILFGTLIFILFALTNLVCKNEASEEIPELHINFPDSYYQIDTEGRIL